MTDICILAEQQQLIQSRRNERVVNLITIFGLVGIIASVQDIVSSLMGADNLMWSITMLTAGVLAVCCGLAMRK